MRFFTGLLLCFVFTGAFAQSKSAYIEGKVIDENDAPLQNVSVVILGKNSGIVTSDSGKFSLRVPARHSLALVFSHTGFADQQKNFFLSDGETETVVVRMKISSSTLQGVTVSDDRERKEVGLVKINPRNAVLIPSTTGGVEAMIKTLVGSNNELTSQYSVRGGNYDENLVYINDYEVYRPYLVSSGQQEGLSLINPSLTRNINFYSGGFQSKYGDKMSSVLDIQYKKPTAFGGTAYVSLLEQGLELEGSPRKGRFTYIVGLRNKSNRDLLSNQPTTGAYIPSASDAQGLFTYKVSEKIQLELLGIFSASRFTFYPESVKKTASVFSPFFTANLGLDVFFEGREKDEYATGLIGFTVLQSLNKKLRLKWMISRFKDGEKENEDIAGAYLFGDRDFDNSSPTFGQIINPLGSGYYQNYGRNRLDISVYNAGVKGSYDAGRHYLQWGLSAEKTGIKDRVAEFEYRDSAGYSLPFSPGSLNIYNVQNGIANLDINKYDGYAQDNIRLSKSANDITMQAGVRFNYNSLDRQFLVSPRAQLSFKPAGKKDIVYKVAAGVYDQPPFFRELRRPDGTLNTGITAQKSIQGIAGLDYNFKAADNRAMRFTAEAYYKAMTDVVPYDIDNVKIQYLGSNNAKAYAAGAEFRLFGELVKDAQSWVSLGLMRTRENLDDDHYYDYTNAAGQVITATSADQVATDSVRHDVGYVRRPTDRLITVGVYLEDYLPTNKNFRVFLNGIYGSNMSYNVPGAAKYRNGLIIPPYIRVDMGFSVVLLSEESRRRSHSPFRGFEDIRASLEVFNLINRDNTISFQLIKDFSNTVYALPNRLTPRLINFKLIGRF